MAPAQYELNLRDYTRIFRKHKFIIFLVFCVTLTVSYYRLSTQTPMYRSSIKVRLHIRNPVMGETQYGSWLGDIISTQIEIIRSRPVAERAAKYLGWFEGMTDPAEKDAVIEKIQNSIHASRIGEASIVQITATTPEAEMPAKIVEAVAEQYHAYDQEERVRHVRSVRLFVEKELQKAGSRLEKSEETLKNYKENVLQAQRGETLRSEIAALEGRLQELLVRATPKHPEVMRLEEQIAEMREQLKKFPREELELNRLTQEVSDNQNLVTKLKEKYEEARLRESEHVSIVSIVEKASPVIVSYRSDKRTGMFLSVFVGLLLGCIAAFFREGLDTSIGAIEDVESFLGVGVLGIIPHMVSKSEKRRSLFRFRLGRDPGGDRILNIREHLVTQFNPRSPEAESYHTLRTALYSVLPQKEKLAIAISSTGPREGKSITCANLAVASAQMGKKTLLVDADFRRPVVHEIFGLERIPGLFEVLTKTIPYQQALKNVSDLLIVGNVEWREALKSPHLGYLNFLTAGHLSPNPPELLHSQEMVELLRVLQGEFDFLIFDCPPVLPVTDTLILAPKLDGVVLVYQSGRTARNALKRAKVQLDTAQAKLLGVVFNDIRPVEVGSTSSYYYRYRKYYSEGVKEKSDRAEAEE